MSGVREVRVAAEEEGLRLDRWFRRRYPGLAFGALSRLMRKGAVRLDGRRVRPGDRVAAGQTVRVPPVGEAATRAPAPRDRTRGPTEREAAELRGRVLHRDAEVIVLDKPAGLAVQGGSGQRAHLAAALEALRFGRDEPPRLVHRLDKDTSGVLLLARSARAAEALGRAFRSRAAEKLYWALVAGVPRAPEGRIAAPLGKRPGRGGERVVVDEAAGRRAATRYAVLARAGRRAAWLELRPETGRTHQIRVHLASQGLPVVGDGKYGGRAAFLGGDVPPRLHLHARAVRLPHPAGGTLHAEAPLPPHMATTWRLLGWNEEAAPDPFVDPERPAR